MGRSLCRRIGGGCRALHGILGGTAGAVFFRRSHGSGSLALDDGDLHGPKQSSFRFRCRMGSGRTASVQHVQLLLQGALLRALLQHVFRRLATRRRLQP